MSHDLETYYLPALSPVREGAVLDFGSGHGRVISFLTDAGFRNVHGFERNEKLRAEMPAEVLERTTFGMDWADFFRSSAEKGKRWDAVILKDVLYYFDDDGAATFLKALRPLLSREALLVIEVFNGATLTGPYVMFKDRGIRRVFTEQSLCSLLEENGYSIEKICGVRPGLSGLRSALFSLLSLVWRWNLRLVYWSERGWDAQNPKIFEKKIFAVARVGGGKDA